MRIVIVAYLLLFSLLIAGQSAVAEKRPLDLPSGGRGDTEDEEDAPETIVFYGGEYEGDAFFWCVDISGSMNAGGALNIMKQNVTSAINSLSDNSEFSVVAFNSSLHVWSELPRRANAAWRGQATTWVNNLQAAGMTCMAPAGVKSLEIAGRSDQTARRILVLSDGVPTCGGTSGGVSETLSAITAANWERIPIDTIYIGSDSSGESFMQTLASMNGGSFSLP